MIELRSISIIVEYNEDETEDKTAVDKLLVAFEETVAKAGLAIHDSYEEEI